MGNETQTSQSNKEENEVLERQYAESYIASRLEKERDYYDNRADGYRKRYMSNQTWIIVCGAIIPIVTLLNETFECCPVFKCWHLGSILNAVIAAVIAIIAGIDKLHQNQNRWNITRYCAQMLRREEMLYRNRVGRYGSGSEKEAKQLLVKRTEDILYYDIASTLQFSPKGGNGLDNNEQLLPETNQDKTE